jgi:AcrR family transcriptional regulator
MAETGELTPGGTGRREERKAQNRAKLLAAARKVFAEKGVGAATARDIVRETDLATGTFYNYFDSKEDVFVALLEELTEQARVAVRAGRREGGTIAERVENGYRAYFELVVEERELFEVFRRNAGSIAIMEQRGLFGAGERELEADLIEWAKAGEIADVDLELVAQAMLGAGVHVASHLVDADAPDPDAAARFLTKLLLGGVEGLSTERHN